MGALSSLLAGFGQGAGEHIAEINERKRQEDVQNKRLANEAGLDYLKNNPDLSPNDKETIFRGILKNYGHKPADIDALTGHAKSFGLFGSNQQQSSTPQTPSKPLYGGAPSPPSSQLPSGLTNRTGETIGGVPSMGIPAPPPGFNKPFANPQTPEEATANLKALKDFQDKGNVDSGGTSNPNPGFSKSLPQSPATSGTQNGLPAMPSAPSMGAMQYTPLHPNVYTDPKNATARERKEEIDNRTAFNQAQFRVMEDAAKSQAKSEADIKTNQAKSEQQIKQFKALQDLNTGAKGIRYYVEEGPTGPRMKVDKGSWAPSFESGADLMGELDDSKQQISDPNAIYKRKDFINGDHEYTKIADARQGSVVVDPRSPTGYSYQIVNKAGQQIGLQTGAPATTRMGSEASTSTAPNAAGGTDTKRTTKPLSPRGINGPLPGASGTGTSRPTTPGTSNSTPPAGGWTPDKIKALATAIQSDDANAKILVDSGNKWLKNQVASQLADNLVRGSGGLTHIDPAVRDAAMRADAILSHTQEIETRISDLDKQGKLGAFASRINEFEAGKVGTSDPDFEKLRVDISMLKSGAGLIHYGGRAGVQSAERFDKLLDSGKMDAQTLKAGVSELNMWLTTYKNMLPKQRGVGGNVPPPNTVSYNDGGTAYDIPLDKITAFEAKHPNAKKGQ